MTTSRPRSCQAARCTGIASLGSRCVKHWIRRQAPYRKLPTNALWWRSFEPALVAVIQIRLAFPGDVGEPGVQSLPERQRKYGPLIVAIVKAADAAGRKNAVDRP